MNLEEKVIQIYAKTCPLLADEIIDTENGTGTIYGIVEEAIRSALSEGCRMGLERAREVVVAGYSQEAVGDDLTTGANRARRWMAAELRRLAQEGK